MTALVIPGLEVGAWQVRSKADPAACALADRHYSRQRPGSGQVGPPGRLLVLVTPCERAVWLTHWPRADLALDGLDAWRCSIFRNEGAGLSSELIEAAMALTAQRWSGRPADGWVTWIDTTKVQSSNLGYCFKQAGWWLDREWQHPRLVRLRARIDPAGQSTPGQQEAQPVLDIRQQRCGQVFFWFGDARIPEQEHTSGVPDRVDQCRAWRLSRPGSGGREWRPCWRCGTTKAPTGQHDD
jgi:hypothetical protein